MADRRTQASKAAADKEMEETLQKMNAQRRKSSVGGSSINPAEDGVEWNPAEREWSEEFMKKAAEKIEMERRHSRGFDDFK